MNHRNRFARCLILAMFAVAFCVAAAPRTTPKVSGNFVFFWDRPAGTLEPVVRIEADENHGGSVSGFYTRDVVQTGTPYHIRVALDNMHVVDAGGHAEAYMSGLVTESDFPNEIGSRYVIKVIDNGEGAKDPADQITDIQNAQYLPGNGDCHDPALRAAMDLYRPQDLVSGKIKIKP
jgi:hypothetical protein